MVIKHKPTDLCVDKMWAMYYAGIARRVANNPVSCFIVKLSAYPDSCIYQFSNYHACYEFVEFKK